MKAVGPDFSWFALELNLEIWKATKAVCRKWRATFSRRLSLQLFSAALLNKMPWNSVKQLCKIRSLGFSTLAQSFLEAIPISFSVGVVSRARTLRSHGRAWRRGINLCSAVSPAAAGQQLSQTPWRPWAGWDIPSSERSRPVFPPLPILELLQICLTLPKTFFFNFFHSVALRW